MQQIRLTVYPADTLTQAKAFYTRPGAASRLLLLRDERWDVEPNFHFGHMARGLAWTSTDAQLEEYVSYWSERIEDTRAKQRENWEGFWRELVERRFARTDEKVLFDQSFTNTERKSATPRPGVACVYSWTLSDAKLLDDRNQLVSEVTDQLNVVLRALGEKPHEPKI